MNDTQRAALIGLLWDYLKKDREHKDRRHTGFGTKTKQGLTASIERVIDEFKDTPDVEWKDPRGKDMAALQDIIDAEETAAPTVTPTKRGFKITRNIDPLTGKPWEPGERPNR